MPEPYSFDSEYYNKVRQSWREKDNKYPDYYYGYMMFIPSYCGSMWGSFAKDCILDSRVKKYWLQHYKSIEAQIDKIKDCEFVCSDYRDLNINNAVIYCDPPYKDSKKDYYNCDFAFEEYYNWCRLQSKNNKIFMSETQMPEDFNIIWQKEYVRTVGPKSTKSIEKLYTI